MQLINALGTSGKSKNVKIKSVKVKEIHVCFKGKNI